ncbi:MAG: efflux RND transporter periplasmic adaptor subunit [Alphaproteobacteria bacterium]|uniref:Efflux RND transporter periplasmic adaptor subunit n=1 Tax=Candidatus Nitrobium versatile TaxID=2884831 RepID=A0A953M2H9_9BACT|nr:efflux RND transporter periplasmic adaptor subunit [Candidatus Nitrobium versatile]
MKKGIIAGAIVVILIAAALIIKRAGNHQEEGAIVLSGNVEVTEVNIGFKLPGRIVALHFDEGQKVKEGDLLAVLDSAELESQVAQSRAYLAEMTAHLEEKKTGSRPQELEQARAGVRHAEAELGKAKRDYERDEMLYGNGAVSAQQRDASRKAYEVALSQHRNALETLSLVKEGPRREDIRAVESRVQQAKAALRAAGQRMHDTVLHAPVAGVILEKNSEEGETVAQGIPVYTIGDLGNPWIKVYVKEDKLGLVKLGQKALVTTDSYPGKTYEGTVSYISSEAEFTPKNVQTQEERVKLVFGVKVKVKNVNDELKPGMPADVKILLQ